jgi:hypothetical protein
MPPIDHEFVNSDLPLLLDSSVEIQDLPCVQMKSELGKWFNTQLAIQVKKK